MGSKIRNKDEGTKAPGAQKTQVLSASKMARMGRVENVFRFIDREARALIRNDVGRGHKLVYHSATANHLPHSTLRVVDKRNPNAICPYLIFKIDDSEHRAVLQVYSKDFRRDFELLNEQIFASTKKNIEKILKTFLDESKEAVSERNLTRDAEVFNTIGDEVVAIEVDSRLHLTEQETSDVRKILGGILGQSADNAKPILVENDFNLEGEEVPTADVAWHQREGDSDENESTTRIFAQKNATVINNRYELKKLLGTGGMGAVFVANDKQSGDTVALKMLHPTLADDQVVIRRFFREVQLIQQVDHENVIRTFDSGIYERVIYYTMEFVRGLPLNKLVNGRKLKSDALLSFAFQIAEGLAAIHEQNIIHRDLKGENLIVTKEKSIKIIDFGIARTEDSNLTSLGEVIGSPAYLAPELWRGETPSFASDLYALGVIYYRMAYGSLPFVGDNPVAVMNKHLHEVPEFGKGTVSAAPPWFLKMIDALLQKDPAKRPVLSKILSQLRQGLRK